MSRKPKMTVIKSKINVFSYKMDNLCEQMLLYVIYLLTSSDNWLAESS